MERNEHSWFTGGHVIFRPERRWAWHTPHAALLPDTHSGTGRRLAAQSHSDEM
jgi:hypothetical protein